MSYCTVLSVALVLLHCDARACRGATAETTPKELLLLSSATWMWGTTARCLIALLVLFSAQRHHLTVPVPGPVLRDRDFSPGDLLCPFWLLVQRSWLYSGFDLGFPRVRTALILALARRHVRSSWGIAGAAWLAVLASRERGVLRHCERLRPSGGLLRERVSAAALAYLQQQAAAGTATPGCLPPKDKGVRTGGRLHPTREATA